MAKKRGCDIKGQEITYTNAIKLTEDLWKCGSKQQKKALLKAVQAHTSFAVTKSVDEMVRRGGGFAAKSILNLNKAYLKNKNGSIKIKWV